MAIVEIKPGMAFLDIQQGAAAYDKDKHLRQDDGGTVLYVKESRMPSTVGGDAAKVRDAKHQRAFETVEKVLDLQLGKGAGAEILQNALQPSEYNKKLIAVRDLDGIGDLVEKKRAQLREASQARALQNRAEKLQQFDRLVDSIMEDLGSKIDDTQTLGDLRNKLSKLPESDLQEVSRQLKAVQYPKFDKEGFRQDLRRQDLGVCQVLAKHGLIGQDRTPNAAGRHTAWTTVPDSRAFTYDSIKDLQKFTGTQFEARNGDFISCTPLDFGTRIQQGTLRATGDKIHISVNPNQVGAAWDIAWPILHANKDRIFESKVTNMPDGIKAHKQCEKDLADFEMKLSTGAVGQVPMTEVEAERKRLKEAVDSATRVTTSAQITVYFHDESGNEQDLPRLATVVGNIAKELKRGDIQPVHLPDSDLSVNEYCSFRYDGGDEGKYIHAKSTDAAHKEKMAQRPLFKELVR